MKFSHKKVFLSLPLSAFLLNASGENCQGPQMVEHSGSSSQSSHSIKIACKNITVPQDCDNRADCFFVSTPTYLCQNLSQASLEQMSMFLDTQQADTQKNQEILTQVNVYLKDPANDIKQLETMLKDQKLSPIHSHIDHRLNQLKNLPKDTIEEPVLLQEQNPKPQNQAEEKVFDLKEKSVKKPQEDFKEIYPKPEFVDELSNVLAKKPSPVEQEENVPIKTGTPSNDTIEEPVLLQEQNANPQNQAEEKVFDLEEKSVKKPQEDFKEKYFKPEFVDELSNVLAKKPSPVEQEENVPIKTGTPSKDTIEEPVLLQEQNANPQNQAEEKVFDLKEKSVKKPQEDFKKIYPKPEFVDELNNVLAKKPSPVEQEENVPIKSGTPSKKTTVDKKPQKNTQLPTPQPQEIDDEEFLATPASTKAEQATKNRRQFKPTNRSNRDIKRYGKNTSKGGAAFTMRSGGRPNTSKTSSAITPKKGVATSIPLDKKNFLLRWNRSTEITKYKLITEHFIALNLTNNDSNIDIQTDVTDFLAQKLIENNYLCPKKIEAILQLLAEKDKQSLTDTFKKVFLQIENTQHLKASASLLGLIKKLVFPLEKKHIFNEKVLTHLVKIIMSNSPAKDFDPMKDHLNIPIEVSNITSFNSRFEKFSQSLCQKLEEKVIGPKYLFSPNR